MATLTQRFLKDSKYPKWLTPKRMSHSSALASQGQKSLHLHLSLLLFIRNDQTGEQMEMAFNLFWRLSLLLLNHILKHYLLRNTFLILFAMAKYMKYEAF